MRSVTIQSIVDRARVHADQRSSGFITPEEALAMFNEVYSDLYDEMVAIDENYFVADEFSISVSSAASEYALPSDFYKIVYVDYQPVSGTRVSIPRYNEADRNRSFTQATNLPTGTVVLRYVPAPTIYTAMSQTIDGVSGWDRLLSLRIAIDMMDAEETNSDRLQRKYDQTLERIRGSLSRDMGMPGTISDVTEQFLVEGGSLRYRLYGDKLHFISTEYLGFFSA